MNFKVNSKQKKSQGKYQGVDLPFWLHLSSSSYETLTNWRSHRGKI